MIGIRFLRENLGMMKEDIRKKFQEQKLPSVNEAIALDEESHKTQAETDQLRSDRNKISKSIGILIGQGKKDEVEKVEEEAAKISERLAALEPGETEITTRTREVTLTIPQIVDPSVPTGKDDSYNIEIQRYGKPAVPDSEIPYHTDIMERLYGIDLEAAGEVAGNGFYYLLSDTARLHSAVLSCAHDFMVDRGFTCVIPPYMICSDVVTGVMGFPEVGTMTYKTEGKDLYLIGTSGHSIIDRFINSMNDRAKFPYTLTLYSPYFRKEEGAHSIEEHGMCRIYRFEKQEMIIICKSEESMSWYNKLRQSIVDFFCSLDILVRALECCSDDLTDLKIKSCDVEAWSSRQKKYLEMGSCSNLGDAQVCRLHIRVKGTDGKKHLAHTLNSTYVTPPHMLIVFFEDSLQVDGSVRVPEAFRPHMGGKFELRV